MSLNDLVPVSDENLKPSIEGFGNNLTKIVRLSDNLEGQMSISPFVKLKLAFSGSYSQSLELAKIEKVKKNINSIEEISKDFGETIQSIYNDRLGLEKYLFSTRKELAVSKKKELELENNLRFIDEQMDENRTLVLDLVNSNISDELAYENVESKLEEDNEKLIQEKNELQNNYGKQTIHTEIYETRLGKAIELLEHINAYIPVVNSEIKPLLVQIGTKDIDKFILSFREKQLGVNAITKLSKNVKDTTEEVMQKISEEPTKLMEESYAEKKHYLAKIRDWLFS